MARDDDEEELLRSVALQNASVIRLERQRAEEELLRAKEALEAKTGELARALAMMTATLESTTDGILVTDGDGNVTGFNGSFVWMWRLGPETMQRKDHRAIVETTSRELDDPGEFLRRVQEIYAAAPHDSYDVLTLSDGRVFERFSRPQMLDGRNVGRVWSLRDVTAGRRAEEALARQAEWFRVTLGSIGDAVITTDTEARVTYVNRVAELLTGWGNEEAAGRPLDDVFRIVHEDTRAPVEQPVTKALRDGVIVGLANHTVLIGRDGTERAIDDSAAPIRDNDGTVLGCVLVFRDITERRRAEQRERTLQAEAASANARFRAFFDQGPIFAGIMDLDGMLVETNRLAVEACGFTREQVVGKPFWDGPWWSPSPSLTETIRAASAQAAAGTAFRAELPYFVADGSERLVDLNILPIKDEAGRVRFLAPTGVDITERRSLEDRLRRLAVDLSEADRRKNEFLAMLAHELRNPLAPIRNALRILRAPGTDATVVGSTSDMMERQVGHMVRLVDDLLDVSRITRGKIDLRKEPLELASTIHHAVEALRPLVDKMQHALTLALPEKPVYLEGDPIRIAQIVGNLLSNACKYTERGGRIVLAVVRDRDQVVVSVRDNGIGIAEDALPHIFEMFTQVDASLARSQSGLGIGLTLVKQLVEMHDGTVEARSAGASHGSEFVVRLPALPEDFRPVAAGTPTAARRAAPHRILIVDDNQDAAESLATLLDIAGNETRLAFDGAEAVDVATSFRPEVVVLDIGLPKLNGYEVAQAIREQPWGKSMVLIALTGWGQDEDRQKSRDAGFDAHMVKPIYHENLAALLAELLPPPA